MKNPDAPQAVKFFDWAIRDAMPDWAAEMVMYEPPNPVERAARRAATWTALNGAQAAMGPLKEFRQAQKRVAGGTTCEDPPGVRGEGPGSMYLAYLRDPDGNKLCGLHRL